MTRERSFPELHQLVGETAKLSMHCEHCGEELLGAVNRCWRCGAVVTAPDAADEPAAQSDVASEAAMQEGVGGDPRPPRQNKSVARAEATARPPQPGGKWTGAAISTWVSFALSGYALITLNFSAVAVLCLAATALVMALWGLFGYFRRWALLAMLLSWLVLAIAGYQLAVQWYEWRYGVKPFTDPIEEFDESDRP